MLTEMYFFIRMQLSPDWRILKKLSVDFFFFFSHLRYGMLERCEELVEAGYDVRQPDKENVTLLHWAAINNRQELVK